MFRVTASLFKLRTNDEHHFCLKRFGGVTIVCLTPFSFSGQPNIYRIGVLCWLFFSPPKYTTSSLSVDAERSHEQFFTKYRSIRPAYTHIQNRTRFVESIPESRFNIRSIVKILTKINCISKHYILSRSFSIFSISRSASTTSKCVV